MKPWYKRGLPGWIVSGGGGGGLSTVSTNSTLTGNGTSGSPLSVAGNPLTFFQSISSTGVSAAPGANQVTVFGFVLPYSLTFSHISFNISTADAVNNCDIGVYNKAGTLIANVGATIMASTGLRTFATLQGAQTIPPGLYVFGFTTNGTTLVYNTNLAGLGWFNNPNIASSVGGVLPASIGALTVTPTTNQAVMALS